MIKDITNYRRRTNQREMQYVCIIGDLRHTNECTHFVLFKNCFSNSANKFKPNLLKKQSDTCL